MVTHSARLLVAALFGLASAGWLSRLPAQADPDAKVKGGGAFPPGWHVRSDKYKPPAHPHEPDVGGGFVLVGAHMPPRWEGATALHLGVRVGLGRQAGEPARGPQPQEEWQRGG